MVEAAELLITTDSAEVEASEHSRALFIAAELIKRVRSLMSSVQEDQITNVLDVLNKPTFLIGRESIGNPVDDPEYLIQRILTSVQKIFGDEHVLPRHLPSVGNLSRAIGAELGLDQKTCDLLFRCGAGHDVGKVDPVVDFFVSQPRKLTKEEKDLTEPHAPIGARVLEIFGAEPAVISAARSHHERLDATGYPHNLPAEKIDYLTRIVSVADVVDAMFDDRPGRETRSLGYVMDALRKDVINFKLDHDFVEAFFRLCARAGYVEGDPKNKINIKTPQLLRECGILPA